MKDSLKWAVFAYEHAVKILNSELPYYRATVIKRQSMYPSSYSHLPVIGVTIEHLGCAISLVTALEHIKYDPHMDNVRYHLIESIDVLYKAIKCIGSDIDDVEFNEELSDSLVSLGQYADDIINYIS